MRWRQAATAVAQQIDVVVTILGLEMLVCARPDAVLGREAQLDRLAVTAHLVSSHHPYGPLIHTYTVRANVRVH